MFKKLEGEYVVKMFYLGYIFNKNNLNWKMIIVFFLNIMLYYYFFYVILLIVLLSYFLFLVMCIIL